MLRDATLWIILIIFKILLLILLLCWIRTKQRRRNLERQQFLVANNIMTYPQPVLTTPYSFQTQLGSYPTNDVHQPQPYTTAPLDNPPPSYSEVAKQAKT